MIQFPHNGRTPSPGRCIGKVSAIPHHSQRSPPHFSARRYKNTTRGGVLANALAKTPPRACCRPVALPFLARLPAVSSCRGRLGFPVLLSSCGGVGRPRRAGRNGGEGVCASRWLPACAHLLRKTLRRSPRNVRREKSRAPQRKYISSAEENVFLCGGSGDRPNMLIARCLLDACGVLTE